MSVVLPTIVAGVVSYAVARAMGPHASVPDKLMAATPIGVLAGAVVILVMGF